MFDECSPAEMNKTWCLGYICSALKQTQQRREAALSKSCCFFSSNNYNLMCDSMKITFIWRAFPQRHEAHPLSSVKAPCALRKKKTDLSIDQWRQNVLPCLLMKSIYQNQRGLQSATEIQIGQFTGTKNPSWDASSGEAGRENEVSRREHSRKRELFDCWLLAH